MSAIARWCAEEVLILPPLPPGEGWGEGELRILFLPVTGVRSSPTPQPSPGGRGGKTALLTVATIAILSLLPLGCIGRQHPAATQPSTNIDPKQAQPAYWLDQPAVAHVNSPSFDALWDACRDAAKADGFLIDRTDYREGLMTTLPLVSKQAYEFWKSDTQSPHGLAQSTLGTMRRTVRFTLRRLDDGTYQATPKVLVERDSFLQRRITSVDQYQNVFSIQQVDIARETERTGESLPPEYWYSVGRDEDLEKRLAHAVRDRLQASARAR